MESDIINRSLSTSIAQFIKALIENNGSFSVESTERKRIHYEFSVEYNSVRILLMVKYCGNSNLLTSKLKFAFFDFLLRYPICLKIIFEKNQINEFFSNAELTSIDRKMIKHISSAWDPDYYNYLSFLQARGLVEVNFEETFDIKLTRLGEKIAEDFEFPECNALIRRCKILRDLYGNKSDKQIERVIHNNFAFVMLYDR